MARTEKFTVAEVLAAIERGHTGVGAARILGCSGSTIRNYANRHKSVKAALDDERRDLVDWAQISLRAAILRGEPWAVSLALKTLGKEHFSERTEITGADGAPPEVVIRYETVPRNTTGAD